jgi:hypothetical protein
LEAISTTSEDGPSGIRAIMVSAKFSQWLSQLCE